MKGMPTGRRRRGLITVLLDRVDAQITPRADARAREMDLEIIHIPGTRTHVYRDRRWDLRQLCDECEGVGTDGSRPCASCDGSGVVTRRPVAEREGAR